MKRTRRIGSITLGITLILSGGVFLINMFFPAFNTVIVLKFWPIILIILGLEVIVEQKLAKGDDVHYKYDFASIFMIAATCFFSMIMAGLEFLFKAGFAHF